MKMNYRLLSAAAFTVLTTLVACKKESTTTPINTDANTELTTQSDDQSNLSVETDAVVNDASVAMESTMGFSGYSLHTAPPICDGTFAYDTTGAVKKLTITYTGTACAGEHKRTGSVVIAMAKGTYWKQEGAVVTITLQNLTITRLRDNKSITLNGTHTVTNVSGGLLINLPTLHTITHTIASSNMSITFDDGTQRTWQVAKKRVFTYDGGIVLTITGTHTEGAATGVAVWGNNRHGHTFTTAITQPLVLKQACDFRITSGAVTHAGWATATATFGLDAAGNPASCPGSGSYYYKVDWTGPGGKTYSAIRPY